MNKNVYSEPDGWVLIATETHRDRFHETIGVYTTLQKAEESRERHETLNGKGMYTYEINDFFFDEEC